ncbi:transport-associated protein [Solidesulfovibrio carbinoliphilus subsp. oakridgensis]|uniref:Transport-associated protein n=1 Tax=Solidesulfovibrio carbinoliphilus subsp. oakridgensis TaxID=694327 RepID=G7QDB5_9BACT|nr:BON domain-containing protein [Solidesulfovibrio carbinoliphilus]EHJ46421.1 transport-associated protein [Solidesulfovibrio carbinoliphilus subsp. oakridgensis]
MKKTATWGVSALSVAALLWSPGAMAAKTIVVGPDDANLRVAQAAPPATMKTVPPSDADNSRQNQMSSHPGQMNADKQGNQKADTEITRQIREAVTDDKSLSTYAHNVKIITKNGKVFLKGPVRTAEERTNIGEKAAAVAGAENVTNSLTIAPKK